MNKYEWLQNNLSKYKYTNVKAIELYKKLKNINISESEEEFAKGYDSFVTMFNNNPFGYENGLQVNSIESNDSDCYFIKVKDSYVPVGFYKIKHPVENVLLFSRKISHNSDEALNDKANIFKLLASKANKYNATYNEQKKADKPGYLRALIATLASLAIINSSIVHFKAANVIETMKCIGDKQKFFESASNAMLSFPLLAGSGVVGWIFMLLFYICLLILVIANIKKIKQEYILTYQKNITKKINKTTISGLDKINVGFAESIKRDTENFIDLIQKGEPINVEKNNCNTILGIIRKKIEIAKEFTDKLSSNSVRGIKKNGTILLCICTIVVGYCNDKLILTPSYKDFLQSKRYEMQVKMDGRKLKSKKIVQISVNDCNIYIKDTLDSKIVYTLPQWTDVELIKKKTIDDVEWSKIKKITDSEIIVGWVPTNCTVPYNAVNYADFEEIPIVSSEASSYLVGEKGEYVSEYAYDWDRNTSWQDGDSSSTGYGEYITLYFDQPTKVNLIQIFPGNARSDDWFYKNERIKKAKLKFSHGSVVYEFDDNYNINYQTIWLNKPVETTFIKIEIKDTYLGAEFNDLCISEIHAYTQKTQE